jgi:hypothetical protein
LVAQHGEGRIKHLGATSGGPPQQATRFTSGRIFNFAWSPKWDLAPARGGEASDAVLIRIFQ